MKKLGLVFMLMSVFSLTSCWESKEENAVEDVIEKTEEMGEDAADAVEDMGDDMGDAMEDAGDEMEDATN